MKCVKVTQMLRMLCTILSEDAYCKYHDEGTTPLLAQPALFVFGLFFFYAYCS